jgi:hypothetical protein
VDFEKELSGLAKNKWVWIGAGGLALVAGFLFVNGQIASANAAASSSGADTSLMYPSTLSGSPISAIGATSGDASSASGSTLDTSALVSLETTMSNNNLSLGLAQLSAQTTAAQLNSQVALAGIQSQTTTNVAQTLASTLATLFGKKSGNTDNFNGALDIGGVPVTFNMTNNVGGGYSSGWQQSISEQLGNNASSINVNPATAAAGSAAGSVGGSVASVGGSSGGGSSVVAGSRAVLA